MSTDRRRSEREIDRIATAFHEAGHACVKQRLGWSINQIILGPHVELERTTGLVSSEPADDQPFENELIGICAGPVAESRFLGTACNLAQNPMWDSDRARVRKVLRRHLSDGQIAEDPLVMRAQALAARAVSDLWPAIERLATILDTRGSANGEDVERALTARSGEVDARMESAAGRRDRAALIADSLERALSDFRRLKPLVDAGRATPQEARSLVAACDSIEALDGMIHRYPDCRSIKRPLRSKPYDTFSSNAPGFPDRDTLEPPPENSRRDHSEYAHNCLYFDYLNPEMRSKPCKEPVRMPWETEW